MSVLQVGFESKLQDEESRRKAVLRTAQSQKQELEQQLLEETLMCKVVTDHSVIQACCMYK